MGFVMTTATWIGVAGLGISLLGSKSAARQGRAQRALSERMTREQLAFQKEQQAKLDAQKKIYAGMTFKNPYADVENVYEDLTVNLQQAQFQAQQGAQQRADILGGLRETAGTSGIAALAQAMAGQGQIQAQRISASIGQQEAVNQRMRAQGASAADMARRGGENWLQSAEMDRQAQLLGMQAGSAAGAAAGLQQAYSNQMAAASASYAAEQASWSNVATTLGSLAETFSGGQTRMTQEEWEAKKK